MHEQLAAVWRLKFVYMIYLCHLTTISAALANTRLAQLLRWQVWVLRTWVRFPLVTVQVLLSLEQGLYHSAPCVLISTLNTGCLVGFRRLAIFYWITMLNNTRQATIIDALFIIGTKYCMVRLLYVNLYILKCVGLATRQCIIICTSSIFVCSNLGTYIKIVKNQRVIHR